MKMKKLGALLLAAVMAASSVSTAFAGALPSGKYKDLDFANMAVYTKDKDGVLKVYNDPARQDGKDYIAPGDTIYLPVEDDPAATKSQLNRYKGFADWKVGASWADGMEIVYAKADRIVTPPGATIITTSASSLAGKLSLTTSDTADNINAAIGTKIAASAYHEKVNAIASYWTLGGAGNYPTQLEAENAGIATKAGSKRVTDGYKATVGGVDTYFANAAAVITNTISGTISRAATGSIYKESDSTYVLAADINTLYTQIADGFAYDGKLYDTAENALLAEGWVKITTDLSDEWASSGDNTQGYGAIQASNPGGTGTQLQGSSNASYYKNAAGDKFIYVATTMNNTVFTAVNSAVTEKDTDKYVLANANANGTTSGEKIYDNNTGTPDGYKACSTTVGAVTNNKYYTTDALAATAAAATAVTSGIINSSSKYYVDYAAFSNAATGENTGAVAQVAGTAACNGTAEITDLGDGKTYVYGCSVGGHTDTTLGTTQQDALRLQLQACYSPAATRSFPMTGARGYSDFLAIKTKSSTTTKPIDLCGDIGVAATKTEFQNNPKYSLDITLTNGDKVAGGGDHYVPNGKAYIADFASTDSDIVIEFEEDARYEVNASGQGDLNLRYNTKYNSEFGSQYDFANIDFLTFEATPAFNRTGTLYVYADKDTYFYEVTKDGAKKVNATYDEDEEAWVLRTRKLTAYAISDRKLKTVDEMTSSSSSTSGGGSTSGKPNPDTGR